MKKTLIILLTFFMTLCVSAKELSLLQVKGKNFIDSEGAVVVLHGLAFSDPDKLEKEGHWNENHFAQAAEWGADIVRFAIHPQAWRERGQDAYLQLLDQGIEWAEKYDMYVIMDWHSIGNLWNQLFQHEMYYTTIKETQDFWRTLAFRYRGNSTVAFYEIFNEPTISGKRFGTCTWAQWQELCNGIIQIIRAYDPETIVLVAGFNWAYDLTPVKYAPFTQKNIAYVAHPYPQKRKSPWIDQWEEDWGFVADTAPVFLTELGFMHKDDRGAHIPCIGDETYGDALTSYCNEKGISWMPWVFDPHWTPTLFSDWDYTPSRQGVYFKAKLQENR